MSMKSILILGLRNYGYRLIKENIKGKPSLVSSVPVSEEFRTSSLYACPLLPLTEQGISTFFN